MAYLDNAATTPIAPEVREAMLPFLQDEFGNPSSRHPLGVRAAEARDRARRHVARAVGARERDVLFTSGGTEANNLAVLGAARARKGKRKTARVVVGPTEHPSVRQSALALRDEGFDVVVAAVDSRGDVDLDSLQAALTPDTVLVAQMIANNEFGSIYPVARVARLVRAHSPEAHFHVDAVQGLGKLELSIEEMGCDSLALSAHKVHALKGTGALVTNGEVPLRPLVFGGGQERSIRNGTEGVAGIVGFGEAARLADERREEMCRATAAARDVLVRGIASIEGARLVEPGAERVDAICGVRLPGPPAEVWLHHLETRGVYTSVGSACHSNTDEVSPALLALGFDAEEARQVMRFSFSRDTTVAEVEGAVAALCELVPELSGANR